MAICEMLPTLVRAQKHAYERRRKIHYLHTIDGLSYAEIAKLMKIKQAPRVKQMHQKYLRDDADPVGKYLSESGDVRKLASWLRNEIGRKNWCHPLPEIFMPFASPEET